MRNHIYNGSQDDVAYAFQPVVKLAKFVVQAALAFLLIIFLIIAWWAIFDNPVD